MSDDLVTRLRAESQSYEEWRVQDPETGAYCIGFSWPNVSNPEREATEWLADHKRRFPDSMHAGYVVARVDVLPTKDRLMREAAAEIERPRAAQQPVCERTQLALQIMDRLALCYEIRPPRVAVACDELIDPSGNLLGWVRKAAALPPLPEPTKEPQ